MSTSDGYVRPAVAADLAIIESWLPQDCGVDTLAMNWPKSRQQFARGRLLVWEDCRSGRPVAYFWGTLDSTDSVLEVDPQHRRRGVARAIADYLTVAAVAAGQPLLEIECPNDSAVQFWRAVGFDVEETASGPYRSFRGRRVLELAQDLPAGAQVPLSIRFLPQDAAYRDAVFAPIVEWSGIGVRAGGGTILLPKVVACFDLEDGENLAVEVCVDAQRIFRGAAKYAGDVGVRRCANGFAVGSVTYG